MEFLLCLTPAGNVIHELLSRKVEFRENPAICKKHDIYGWYDASSNVMSICTDRIKRGPDPDYYFNETLFHEAVHAAQDCKAKNSSHWYVPFGINPALMTLSQRRREDLATSVKIHPNNRAIEHEAFWMEDKPSKVEYVIRKYCL